MAFRVIMIESEVKINLKLNNIIISKSSVEDIWVPISDISMIVIDNLKVSITTRMLCTLAENNIGVIICDQKHLPIGFYSDYNNHSRASKIIGYQINKSQEFYDELWSDIVKHKIQNQSKVLKRLYMNEEVQQKMHQLSEEIVQGDKSNREAHAAKVYFNELMDTTFSRGNEDILLNSGLDYGYAIVRSYISRLCVGYGLNTQLGIHHKNEYNRFNLVDDLLEPVRTIVDEYAYRLLLDEEYFKPEHRRKLVNILNHKIIYKSKEMYIANMLEEYVIAIAALIMGLRSNIEYPDQDNYIGAEDKDEL